MSFCPEVSDEQSCPHRSGVRGGRVVDRHGSSGRSEEARVPPALALRTGRPGRRQRRLTCPTAPPTPCTSTRRSRCSSRRPRARSTRPWPAVSLPSPPRLRRRASPTRSVRPPASSPGPARATVPCSVSAPRPSAVTSPLWLSSINTSTSTRSGAWTSRISPTSSPTTTRHSAAAQTSSWLRSP